MTTGVLHPGEMGAAIGAAMAQQGHEVWWCSAGRSEATRDRADEAGLREAASLPALLEVCDLVISVCPPHAAVATAGDAAAAAGGKIGWRYLDANAIAPSTAEKVAAIVGQAGARYTDGGIIGPPPTAPGLTRLYLSGPDALPISEQFATPLLECHVVDDRIGSASAVKLAYASWTKGSAALLLAARAAAARSGVDAELVEEWRTSQPGLVDRWEGARRSAGTKGWRWAGEMTEIARMYAACGLPEGFHQAAAQVFEDPTTLT